MMKMSKLTPEQQLAVDKSGTNIIVSAGAGSGKTTVLKERVLRELKSGVKVNDLIILTFTNNAASEMKERIRKIISQNPEVSEQALYLDSAYITTFDSFAQSLVKKYNYLLNISKDFGVVDASIINLEIKRIIDEIFEEAYDEGDDDFSGFISDFAIKNDKEIRKSIASMYKATNNIIDKTKFFDTYIDTFYNDTFIDNCLAKYEEMIFDYQNHVSELLEQLSDETLRSEVQEKNLTATTDFLNATTYEEIRETYKFKLAANKDDAYTENGARVKSEISTIIKEMSSFLEFSLSELKEHYLITKRDASVIISLLKKIDKQVHEFKLKNNCFEFHDIALKAIELVRDFESVREEIKNKTYEIMIDEYQDTNDIQETFISYIENNNVYMVGDIKQSIYRFRNANPYIFKNKYDKYREQIGGFKIDLNKNFRSRDEVINNINLIFNNIMFDNIGGANYKKEHQMVFGNTKYMSVLDNTDYNMEILNYDIENTDYKEDEVEAFIIANDILRRISNKEKTVHIENDEMVLKDIDYQDFVILVDKGKNFELLKKVLESKGIPTTIDKDISIKEEDEIFILKNFLELIVAIKENRFDNKFKHAFLSISRSYICQMSDDTIFKVFVDNTYKDTELYKIGLELAQSIDKVSNKKLLMMIVEKLDFFNKLILVGDIETRTTKLEYFIDNAANLNKLGYDIHELINYFEEVLNNDDDIKMSLNASDGNSVKIMTIHKSKGLEYNVVYLPYLNSNFTYNINKTDYHYANKYGFILPFYKDGKGKTFINSLYKQDEKLETLSEKIRLFYVALTRPKEKFIMINKVNNKIKPVDSDLTESMLANVTSLGMLISLLSNKLSKYSHTIDLHSLNISDDYNLVKKYNYQEHISESDIKLSIIDNNYKFQTLDSKHFSKPLNKVIDRSFKDRLDFGTYMHYLFEVFDFKNNNLDDLDIDEDTKDKLLNFLNHDEVKNIKDSIIYKEHEIRFEKDGNIYHGFIDLMLEYDDHFDIIDYKLSNISSEEYVAQLNGYKDYIEDKYQKSVNIYLYSINKNKFFKIN